MNNKKSIVFSAIQPSGFIHLGNFIGAISQWRKIQNLYDCFFCIADLHTLTSSFKNFSKNIKEDSYELACFYISCGINSDNSLIFFQSDVFSHTYFTWILNCFTPINWLEKMTQFKIKNKINTNTGLLTYPLLMSSDILLYNANIIPVGNDQKQHFELIVKIAKKFNKIYGNIFKIPSIIINKIPRIMSLNNPLHKMSKSFLISKNINNLNFFSSKEEIAKNVKSAITDSNSEISFNNLSRGLLNLFHIYMSFSNENINEIFNKFNGKKYFFLKNELTELLIDKIIPIKNNYNKIYKEKKYVLDILNKGALKANELSENKLKEISIKIKLK